MTGLKEVLLKEQGRLENIIAAVKRQLENTPPGSLRISTSKKWNQLLSLSDNG